MIGSRLVAGPAVKTAAIVLGVGLLVAAAVYGAWGFGWWVGLVTH